jgi:AraC-like DNA-binding protein
VRSAGGIEAYLGDPFGAWCGGAGFLHFFAEPTLCGTVFWGTPDAAAVDGLTRVLEVELPGRSPRHRAFVDTTRLTGVDAAAFQRLVEYLGPRAAEFGRNVIRQAMVRAPGVLGAMVAGFYEVTPSSSPERTRVFVDTTEALAWLEVADPPALLADLAAAQAAASGVVPTVRAVREQVAARPRGVTLAAVARGLGMSPNRLREELRLAGTGFRREVNAARVQLAETMLAGSDVKLSAIAHEVGCCSLAHFSTLFRKHTGRSPSEFRALHRR